MFRHFIFAGVVSLCLSGTAAAQVFNPETFTLKNGMQVVVVPNHRVPVVSHMVWYKIGSGDEIPGKTGLAHMVEHMMFKGTKTLPAGEFSRIVVRNGGKENAFTTADYTTFFQNVARDKLPLMMKLEADRMANLALRDQDFQPERQVVLEERRMRIDNNPAARLDEQMRAALFLNSRYHHPVIGWRSEIEHYVLSDVVAFHQHWYMPNNAILVVSGDITAKELRPLAEKYYGVIPPRPVPPRVETEEPEPVAGRTLELRDPDVRQPSWSRFYLAPSHQKGDIAQVYPLEVLSEILGDGLTSRLYKTLVVDRKLAAEASASYNSTAVGLTAFTVEASPRPGVTIDELQKATEEQLSQVAQMGVTEEEVTRAKQRLRASVTYARDSYHTGARVLGEALATGENIAEIEDWPARIGAVTVEQVNAAAKAVLDDKRSVTGLLLPTKDNVGKESDGEPSIGSMGSEIR